jgi:hypothetical protein
MIRIGSLSLVMLLFFSLSIGAFPAGADEHNHGEPHQGHEAAHGGCLSEIDACEVGHAEIRLDKDVLQCWFVGGGKHTDRAVRVPDEEIVLAVTPDKGPPRTLVLEPKPMRLAGEQVGDCSYFEGRAEWLAGITAFRASGKVHFKGRERELRIDFPKACGTAHTHHRHGEAEAEREAHHEHHGNKEE